MTEDASAEATDPYRLPDAEADQLLATAPWKRYVVVGDSLAEGLGEATPATPTCRGRTGPGTR